MTRRRHKPTASDPRQKAQDLIDLALDEGTTIEERRNAAMRAVKFIDKYDLLSRPFEGNDTIQAAVDVIDKLADPSIMDSFKKIGEKIGQMRRGR